jgi:hypothetical protein
MRRVLAPGFAIVAGLTLSACGGASPAQKAVSVMPQPLIANTPPVATAVAVGWTPVQTAQAEAAQLQAAETQYATCYAYAGLDQGLIQDTVPTTMALSQSCATYGLSSAEVWQIQDLLMQTA